MVANLSDRDLLSVATATYGRGRRVGSNQPSTIKRRLRALVSFSGMRNVAVQE